MRACIQVPNAVVNKAFKWLGYLQPLGNSHGESCWQIKAAVATLTLAFVS